MPSSSGLQSLQSIVQTDVPALPGETASPGLLKSHQDSMAQGLVLRSVMSQHTSSVQRVALQTLIYLESHFSVVSILLLIVKDMSYLQGHKGF